jgi:hypothetical protein
MRFSRTLAVVLGILVPIAETVLPVRQQSATLTPNARWGGGRERDSDDSVSGGTEAILPLAKESLYVPFCLCSRDTDSRR